jgi:hypothetical protein
MIETASDQQNIQNIHSHSKHSKHSDIQNVHSHGIVSSTNEAWTNKPR